MTGPAHRAHDIPTTETKGRLMGDKGPGSKGGGKKPKTSTKKAKKAAGGAN